MKKQIQIEKVDLKSMDIVSTQKEKLRQLFPEVFSEDKINFEKLKLTLGEEIDESQERYEMTWAGKTNCFKIIQEQSLGTLKPVEKDSVDWEKTQNLFIEGDNLEVLKLLQKSYNEKIKMIYIDPPYNTGQDFVYKDKFGQQLDEYLKLTGQIDEKGNALSTNSDSDGRYHSNWINMLYPRLFLARNLLRDDGVIFISIDDNEVDNLKKICNEVFGEENFIESLIWKKRATPPNDRSIGRIHEYILVYSKSSDCELGLLDRDEKSIARYENPDNDSRGPWVASDLSANGKGGRLVKSCVYPIRNEKLKKDFMPSEGRCWLFNKEKMERFIKEGRIGFRENTGAPYLKRYLNEVRQGLTLPTMLTEHGYSSNSALEVDNIFEKKGIFEYAKPIKLLTSLIKVGTKKEDIVLDFFAGSGTTAHAIMELNKEDGGNRKFILVQIPEQTDKNSETYKAGYKNIAEIVTERIRRVIKNIQNEKKDSGKQKKLDDEDKKNELDLGFKVFRLDKSNFKIWDAQTKDIQTALNEHINPVKKESSQDEVLYELILKSGLSLTTNINEIKVANKKVFSIEEGMLLICLEKELTSELIKKIAEMKPARFYCLDDGFKGNDQLKANAVEIFKNVETVDGEKIVFRTV